jgi:hypothetical protein
MYGHSAQIPLTGCRLHRRPQTFLAHDCLQASIALYEIGGTGVFGLQHNPNEKTHRPPPSLVGLSFGGSDALSRRIRARESLGLISPRSVRYSTIGSILG